MTRSARTRRPQRGAGDGIRWPTGVRRVPTDELTWRCDPAALAPAYRQQADEARAEAEALVELAPTPEARARLRARARLSDRPRVDLDELIGQERAIEAIATGLSTEAPGFHVFVCGPRGSGRQALVEAALRVCTPPLPRPRDRVYVANFRHPERPVLLTLPRGKGRRFRRDLDRTLAVLRRAIGSALAAEHHVAKCDRLRRRADNAATRLIDDLAAELRGDGLIVGPIPEGFGTPELKVDVGAADPLARRTVERRLAEGELRATRAIKRSLKQFDEARARLEEVAGEARAVAARGRSACGASTRRSPATWRRGSPTTWSGATRPTPSGAGSTASWTRSRSTSSCSSTATRSGRTSAGSSPSWSPTAPTCSSTPASARFPRSSTSRTRPSPTCSGRAT